MCRRDIDQPFEYCVKCNVGGIEAELNEQFTDRQILRRAFECAIQHRRQIWIVAIHSPSSNKPPGSRCGLPSQDHIPASMRPIAPQLTECPHRELLFPSPVQTFGSLALPSIDRRSLWNSYNIIQPAISHSYATSGT